MVNLQGTEYTQLLLHINFCYSISIATVRFPLKHSKISKVVQTGVIVVVLLVSTFDL